MLRLPSSYEKALFRIESIERPRIDLIRGTALAGVHVSEASEIQILEQILDPCVLLDSALRDYEINLDPGFSAKVEKVELDPKL